MAIYHLSIKIITRGNGKSAVAAAAYRAGETIKNEYDGVLHDYTRKGGIDHTEILLPENAPVEYAERAVLWNAVEKSERYKTAQLAREIEIALPVELTQEQNISLVRRYVKENFVTAGMCADICIHVAPQRNADAEGGFCAAKALNKVDGNPHAHIMLTMRPIEKDGSWGQKSRTVDGRKINTVDWNDRDKAEVWRKAWAEYCNETLRINGSAAVVDHRSYERQGIEQIPTVHLGSAASQMEKRGVRTERGDMNRKVEVTNRELRQLSARIAELEKWTAAEMQNDKTPTFADIISNALKRCGKPNAYAAKDASQMLLFLRQNHVYDMADLEGKVKSMQGNVNRLRGALKPLSRRIETLEKHLTHSENFKNYRKITSRYDELYSQYEAARKAIGFGVERKTQKALDAANEYYEAHRSELFQFDAAEKYLRGVLQERFDPKKLPAAKWREELVAKTSEREAIFREYKTLKDETAKVEKIRRSVAEILQVEMPERTLLKRRNMEL